MAAFKKKIWKDRITEYPNRRTITDENGTSKLVTVAREEGTISQQGDAFSAENMNDLENRIADAGVETLDTMEEIQANKTEGKVAGALAVKNMLGGVTFGIDKDGNPGYKKAGADTVYPFKSEYKNMIIERIPTTPSGSINFGVVVPSDMKSGLAMIVYIGSGYADIFSIKLDEKSPAIKSYSLIKDSGKFVSIGYQEFALYNVVVEKGKKINAILTANRQFTGYMILMY